MEYGYCSISKSNQNSSFNMTIKKSPNNLNPLFFLRQSIDTFFNIRWKTKDLHNVENGVSKFDRVQASSPLCHRGMYIQTETINQVFITYRLKWIAQEIKLDPLHIFLFKHLNICHRQLITPHCLQDPPTLHSGCPSTWWVEHWSSSLSPQTGRRCRRTSDWVRPWWAPSVGAGPMRPGRTVTQACSCLSSLVNLWLWTLRAEHHPNQNVLQSKWYSRLEEN